MKPLATLLILVLGLASYTTAQDLDAPTSGVRIDQLERDGLSKFASIWDDFEELFRQWDNRAIIRHRGNHHHVGQIGWVINLYEGDWDAMASDWGPGVVWSREQNELAFRDGGIGDSRWGFDSQFAEFTAGLTAAEADEFVRKAQPYAEDLLAQAIN